MVDLANLRVSFLAGTLGQGGAERQLYYMVRALKQAGAHPRVLTFAEGEFWEAHLRKLDVPVIWVGQQRSRMQRVKRILSELRSHPADLLQSLHFYTNAYVGLCGGLLGIRSLGSIRNDGKKEMREGGSLAGRLGLRVPGMIAANSGEAIRFARRYGLPASRLAFLANAVDTDRFSPGPREERGELRVLAVGRLHRQKRFDRFIRLVARLQVHSRTPVKGTIVGGEPGSGNARHELEAQACSMGLTPGVLTFQGGAADTVPFYQGADLFVLTSDSEGTPNVILEAMSCGLPVVATRVGGVPDVVQDGVTGCLVDPGDEQAMVRTVLSLLEDRDRRLEMGDRARRFVMQNHSIGRLAPRLSEVYDKVLH
jgi:glycosyltransferase involved in cell wall biosynthesis